MGTVGVDTALVGGVLVARLPNDAKWWFLQNQSQSPMKVVFNGASFGSFTSIVLDGAPLAGGAGGYLSSVAFPYFDPKGFTLSSTDPTAPFGSASSFIEPTNTWLGPGSGPTDFG